MRLLITTDTVGGVWTYTKELSEGLLERGHSVLLISMGRNPSPDQRAWAEWTASEWLKTFRYLVTEHPLEWMQNNARCYTDAESFLMAQVNGWRPDLLHLNQYCYGALPTDVPKIIVAHSDVISWSRACRGVVPIDSNWFCHYVAIVTAGLRQANAVVAPSRWMLDALCNSFDVTACRAIIANGRQISVRKGAHPRLLQAVTIGRVWDEGKNIRILEDVATPMPMLVGGELSLEEEPPFTSSRMQLLGRLSEQAALRLFAESSIYIITSRYEPFGLAPLEAALSGCAILANDIPSLREIWAESACYFTTADELTRLLHNLYADSTLLAHAARKASARARSLYSRGAMISKYLSLYKKLTSPAHSELSFEATAQHVS